ncbi:unnamed protein product [Pseudo-nitzschia multistriata]|uniref:Uncharacterized protein n=1 Tax=Pseudo-nitzschia multistriata TaxID=183589 RepID=A0A448Z2P9_9STRA|nr:unnamed protein product [Pseudo-nitzschia multistriata]
MMSSNPIFPASRAELKALHPVIEITCADSKSEYDEVKSRYGHPVVADTAGAEYRARVTESYMAVRSGECNGLFEDLIACNGNNIYDYAKQCKQVRDSLQMCAIKNKLGELSK